MDYIITIILAFMGGYIFKKLKLPVGAMIGSLLFVGTYQCITNNAILPSLTKDLLQICSGVLIGNKITIDILKKLKVLWKPYISMMMIMISILFLMSLTLIKTTDIDIMTGLFSLAPGGANDLTILSADFDANISYVALIHTSRKLLILMLVPFIAKILCSKEEHIEYHHGQNIYSLKYLCFAIVFGMISGYIFNLLQIKGGMIIGSLIGAAIYKLCIHDYHTPKQYSFILQVLAGAFVGVTFNKDLFMSLSTLWIAVVIVGIETIMVIIINAVIMKRYFHMSKLTSILASTPGNLSDITLLSEELGGDMPTVATLQILRMFSIVIIIPTLASLLYGFL